MYYRNRTFDENFKLKLCTWAQSYALGTRTKFQLKILWHWWFLALCIFARLFWRARETLVKQPPGPAKSNGISSHGLDLVFLEYFGFRTRRIKALIIKVIPQFNPLIHINSLWPSHTIWRQNLGQQCSGNGLLPDGTKPMFTSHWCSSVAFTWEHFTASAQATILYKELKNIAFEVTATSPMDQGVNNQSDSPTLIIVHSLIYRESH